MADLHIPENEIPAILEQARQLHRAGKRDEANLVYLQVLNDFPDNVEALRLRAVVCMETGQTRDSETLLRKALALEPQNRFVLNNLGSLYHAQKKYDTAVGYFQKALQQDESFSYAACNLGNTWQALGKIDKAIAAYQNALELDPRLAAAWNNLGSLMNRLHRRNEAEKLFHKALSIDPKYKDAWNNLGICYANSGRVELAFKAYEKALGLDKHYSLALNNKGNLLLRQNYPADALRCFETATEANANVAEAWNGCGYAHKNLGNLQKAVRCFRKAIELKHDFAEAWNNLGLTYADQGRLDDALDAFRSALEIRPNYVQCHSNLLLYLNYSPDIHEKTLFEAHTNWAAAHQHYPPLNADFTARADIHQPIRVGFVSADFCRHPISYFLLPVLRTISGDRFRVTAYSNNLVDDDLTAVARKHVQQWRQVADLSDHELARQIRDDEIDVLFDLSGHTSGHRLRMFSLKPAPLQITWLGYPHTSSLDSMDYLLSDSVCLPDFLHWQFTEKICFLPHSRCCYAAPDYAPPINPLPAQKNGFVTFGSFNNPVKLNDKTIALWSDILHRCKNSILVLSWKTLADASIANRLLDNFKKYAIDAGRITLLGETRPHAQVFTDYQNIDIALDTYPFSGGLTSCEAMWMGVPVVTLAGKKPASRQTAGMLAEIGLDELVSFSPGDYTDVAVGLAGNLKKLAMMRESLRTMMLDSTLCDAEAFTEDFENTLTKLFVRKQEQLKQSAQ